MAKTVMGASTSKTATPKLKMKQLFDFQKEATGKILDLYTDRPSNTALLISLMGTGKTVMASWIINEVVKQRKRCLFVVDLNCLIYQISEELFEWRIPHSIIQASRKYDSSLPVAVASAQTIEAKIDRGASFDDYLGEFDFIIFDEAHNLSYRKIAISLRNHYLSKGAFILGMTATPWRLNSAEYLGQWYDRAIVTIQPPDLIKIGKAVPCRIFGFEDYFDLDKIATGADGDYLDSDVEKQATTVTQMQKVYEEWWLHTPDQTTIAFCSTVNHAIALSDYFNSQGVKAAYITGETVQGDRLALFKSLEEGEIKVLFSINTLTVGFNCKRVSCVLYVRVTKSKSGYHQATGRAARQYPSKEFFYILDFGANYKSLGSPMSYQDYSIEQKPVGYKEKTKICPICGDRVSIFARICPNCGHVFEKQVEERSDYDEPELDLDVHMVEYFCQEDQKRLAKFRHLKKQCYSDRVHPDTASTQFKSEFGYLPPLDWHFEAVLGKSPNSATISKFKEYLSQFAPHDFWVKMQLKAELGDGFSTKRKSKGNQKKKEAPPRKFTTTVHWWDILECDRYATPEQVKSAYRKAAMKWHPDVCKEKISEAKMKEINNAWEEFERFQSVAI